MGKMTIHNDSDLGGSEAVKLVARVIGMGRISRDGTFYCFATLFDSDGGEYVVYAELTKAGHDTFRVANSPRRFRTS